MITLNEFLSTAMLENLPLDFTAKKKKYVFLMTT